MYDKYLLPLMQRRGFDGWYSNKAGQVSEGSALFYRTSIFELVAKCVRMFMHSMRQCITWEI
ncbi:MAG: hypothetical protein HC872_05850 [Gammaproteobacteria bacterium]|nr:hypothetical protein [Gammaproteobacteria bacterium]